MAKYIDADKVKEYILSTGFYCDTEADRKYSAELIDELFPTADVQEVKHGRWVDGKRIGLDGTFHWFRQCSECLYEREDDNEDKDTSYCPNCGALMVNEDE